MTSAAPLPVEKIAEYRELVQFGAHVGVGGKALASILDSHELLRARAEAAEAESARLALLPAQAPTTAVLTEDERAFFYRRSFHISSIDDPVEIKYRAIIDRLTVGAPAPAPTRAQIAQMAGNVCPFLSTVDRARLAKAFLALIAKGDTP